MLLMNLLGKAPLLGDLLGAFGLKTQSDAVTQNQLQATLDKYFSGGVKFGQGVNPLWLVIGVFAILITIILIAFKK